MTLLTPTKLRLRRRIHRLPTVTHDCATFGIWVRKSGKLACKVCSKP